MKFLTTCLLSVITSMTYAQPFTFMTYNIRLDVASDGENAWEVRKQGLASQVRFYEPDVLGIQEGLPQQVKFLEENLDEYDYYGVGREDGKEKGEFSALYYKKDIFNVLKKGTFWLSETPDVPSKGWDAALPRICTYMLLETKNSSQQFWVLNTHFDHVGVIARKNSIDLIIKKMQVLNTEALPVILMGDLNLTPDTPPIQLLFQSMDDSREVSINKPFGPLGTSNGFNFMSDLSRRIDYIAVSKQGVQVRKYAVLTDSYDQKYYSDHLPVFVEVIFSGK